MDETRNFRGPEAGPIQPTEELVPAEAEAKLIARIERVPPAVREARLARDREGLLQLQLEGPNGPAWRRIESDLCAYGLRTLPAKVRNGEIFQIMRDVGVPMARDLALPTRLGPTDEDIEDITQEVLVRALSGFQQLLLDGQWDPSRESVACLRTYFFGRCALVFRTPWRKWRRERRRRLQEHPAEVVYEPVPTPDEVSAPATAAVIRIELVRALASIEDSKIRDPLVLKAREWTNTEIAACLETSPKAIEYRLKKGRQLLANLRDIGHGVA